MDVQIRHQTMLRILLFRFGSGAIWPRRQASAMFTRESCVSDGRCYIHKDKWDPFHFNQT